MAIYFYSKLDEYGEFSNLSLHGFELDGKTWPSVEHYFQAQKFPGTDYAERIRRAKNPKQAKSLGRSRSVPLRPDWEEVKIGLMRGAILRKFETHADLRALLLSTGDEELIESAPNDYFWGAGRTGTGQNWTGKLLMEVRAILRARETGEA